MSKYHPISSVLVATAWIALCCCCCCWTVGAYGEDANKTARTRLRIVGFFPHYNESLNPIWPGGFYCIPAALMAIEQINNANLLPGYELDFEYFDSGGCVRHYAVMRYLKEIASRATPPVAIIGPGCSEAALALASFSSQPGQEAVMVSYGASTPTLSNLVAFPYFLRTVHSQTFMGQAMAEFVTHFNWKSIATVYEDGLIQRSTVLSFHASFYRLDGEIDTSSTHRLSIPNNNVTEQTEYLLAQTLEQIKHRRIIFAFVHKEVGRCLMLHAANRKMAYPSYVWVFPQLLGSWWVLNCTNGSKRECTAMYNDTCEHQQELINQTVNGAFHFSYSLNQTFDISIDSGLTVSQYQKQLEIRTNNFVDEYNRVNRVNVYDGNTKHAPCTNTSRRSTPYASSTYDAVWAVARGLAVTEEKLQSVNLSLADHAENFAYISKVLHSSILNNVSFVGASGNISFNQLGTVETPVVVKQLQWKNDTGQESCLEFEVIRTFRSNSTSEAINGSALYWNKRSESQPTDSFPPRYITLTSAKVNIALLVVVLLLTFILLIWNCGAIFVNYCFREAKDVKKTSPPLNNFIFSGHFCIIVYVIAFTIVSSVSNLEDVYYGTLCNLLPWTLSIGYSLVNGTIFLKTFRLYKVFTARKKVNYTWVRILKDECLISVIVAIVAVDIILLILFTVLTPLYKVVLERRIDNQLMEINAPMCVLSYEKEYYLYITIGFILGLKFFLLACVAFSAFLQLKAKIPKSMELFNDSGQAFTFSLLQLVILLALFLTLLLFNENMNYERRLSVMYSVLTLGPLVMVAVSLSCFGMKHQSVVRLLWMRLQNSCYTRQKVEDCGVVYQSSACYSQQRVSWLSMQALYSPRFPRRRSQSSISSSLSFNSYYSSTSPHSSNATSLTSIGSAL